MFLVNMTIQHCGPYPRNNVTFCTKSYIYDQGDVFLLRYEKKIRYVFHTNGRCIEFGGKKIYFLLTETRKLFWL